MGWWEQDIEGHSFPEVKSIGLWGDGAADILADAIREIIEEFQLVWERPPTKLEIRCGLEFHLRTLEIPDDGYEPVRLNLGQPDGEGT